MIRCDDIFVDSNASQFLKVCQIIRQHGFDHLIGITPIGEGARLWAKKNKLWKMHFLTSYGFFVNYRLKKLVGEKSIGDNMPLVRVLETEFGKYNAIPALHGLHHYKYSSLPRNKVYEELLRGKELVKELFGVRVDVFTPPFNAWNNNTKIVCDSLNLSIDECRTGFDRLIPNMNSSQIEELAKLQSSVPEVYYHPYRITDLEKFELYLRVRRKYC